MKTKQKTNHLSRHIAILRITFGVMWAIDAIFKWRPAFANNFLNTVSSVGQGQPAWLNPWFHFWSHTLSSNPHLFATLTALIESVIAIALLVGFAKRVNYLSAAVFSLLLWAIPEGFGGPYSVASTDIGAGIIYAVVFLSLYGLERLAAHSSWSVDNALVKRITWWSKVANP